MSLNVWRNLPCTEENTVVGCHFAILRWIKTQSKRFMFPFLPTQHWETIFFSPATLLYIHQISRMVVGLRQSWRFSGRGSSEMPLGSGTRTRRLFLMATPLAGDLAVAVGDVVMLVFKLRHPSWSNLHLEGQMFDMSNVTLHVSLVLNKQDIPC